MMMRKKNVWTIAYEAENFWEEKKKKRKEKWKLNKTLERKIIFVSYKSLFSPFYSFQVMKTLMDGYVYALSFRLHWTYVCACLEVKRKYYLKTIWSLISNFFFWPKWQSRNYLLHVMWSNKIQSQIHSIFINTRNTNSSRNNNTYTHKMRPPPKEE